jgi:hypothetical protein
MIEKFYYDEKKKLFLWEITSPLCNISNLKIFFFFFAKKIFQEPQVFIISFPVNFRSSAKIFVYVVWFFVCLLLTITMVFCFLFLGIYHVNKIIVCCIQYPQQCGVLIFGQSYSPYSTPLHIIPGYYSICL